MRAAAIALACPLLLSRLAAAQEAAPQAAPPPPPATAQQPVEPAPGGPGVLDSLSRWFDEGAANFRAQMQGVKQRMEDLNEKAAATGKSAVDAMVKLPATRVISGRERCAVDANGAPDCQAAADALCRKQGLASGKSMDFTSAEQCPARVWLGRQSREECTTVTFISRAMCQ
jgi:hypothetical protein